MKDKNHYKKGISPVIATILLLLIIVATTGIAFTFLSRIQETTQTSSQEVLVSTTTQLSSNFIVENVDVSNNVVYVRNSGQNNITGFAAYIDNNYVESYSDIIEPNSIGMVSLIEPLQMGDHTIKITSGLAVRTQKFTVPDQYTIEFGGLGF